jgi:hypothetical protein
VAERKGKPGQAKATASSEDTGQAEGTDVPSGDDTPETGQRQGSGEQQADDTATSSTSSAGSAAVEAATTTRAAPLEAPEKLSQRTPHLGDPPTSTNPVAANSGLRSVAGADHRRLCDAEGNDLTLEDLFVFPEQGSPSTLATVKQRVFEEFTYPGTTTRTQHLMYPEGALIPVGEAFRVLETFKHADDSELPKP